MKRLRSTLGILTIALSSIVMCIHHSAAYLDNLDNIRQPTIGIVTLPLTLYMRRRHPGASGSIPSSYKKWVEQTGSRAVVIPHFASKKILRKLVGQVNGLMFIGGGVRLYYSFDDMPTRVMKKLAYIYRLGLKQNTKNGGNFPIWGTCLGFEVILSAESKFTAKFTKVNSVNVLKQIQFMDENYRGSYFEKAFRPEVKQYLQTHASSYYHHHNGMRVKDFIANKNLNRSFKVIAYYRKNGMRFVSAIQHRRYPIAGTQFHPEKLLFEHKKKVNVHLTQYSSMASQEMSRILFEPTLRNMNMFDNQVVLNRYLMENFVSVRPPSCYESIFLFTKHHFNWLQYKSKHRDNKWLKSK